MTEPMGLTRLSDRWQQLDELFEQAMALPANEADAFCRTACGGDQELYEFLQDLVRSADLSNGEQRGSIAQLARDVAAQEALIGQRVGAYQFEALLGRGGMGVVYLASRADGEFEKKVAVKIVRTQLDKDELSKHFRTERQVLANLHHPSIPALVDAGQFIDGRPYFICDYVDGVPIDVYCERNELSIAARLALFCRVGEALQHAHNNLVLHLDIKPVNVLVQPDGTPSLLDFGVARLMGELEVGHRAFSPGYASPEQIRGEQLSPASDVYSLGALLYYLLAGKPPFSSPRFAPSHTIMTERTQFAERLAHPGPLQRVDTDVRAIVHKAMAEHPTERYATVESLLRDIEYYRNGLPLSARANTFTYRLGKNLRRNKLTIGTAAVAFALLAAFGLREADLRRQAQTASLVAEQAAETARQVSDFLINIFEVSDPSESRGSTVTARELLDTAATRVGDELADQPLVAANMMHTMGRVYTGLGLHKQATPMLEKALALTESTDEKASIDHANVLHSMGEQYDAIGRHADARRALVASLEIRERERGPVHRDVSESLIALGRLNTLTENFDEAEAQLNRALSINDKILGQNDPLLAQNLRHLGFLYSYLWRYKDAEEVYKRAVVIEEARGSDHPGLATSLSSLADAVNRLERHEEAIATYEQALEMLKKSVSSNHPTTAKTLQGLGLAYTDLEKYDRAEQYLLKALEIRDAALGPMHPATGFTVGALGTLYTMQERLEEARQMLTRSLAIMREVHPEEHGNVSYEKYALAEVHQKLGQLDEAERLTKDAIQYWTRTLAEDDKELLDGQWQLANIYRDQVRYDEAAKIYARVFAAYEQKENMSSNWAREVADEYAGFLRLHGQDVEPKALFKRLRH